MGRDAMIKRIRCRFLRRTGFSLIEVLIGIFLVAVAVIGLAQLILVGMMNNSRASDVANAVFLAQQEIDYLRTLTRDELSLIGSTTSELLDLNADGATDFRRITVVTFQDPVFAVKVLVFSTAQSLANASDLIANPEGNRVRARMETVISR
jgi:prepilin-type N-terminal cleavage/methylation domain-containing protein